MNITSSIYVYLIYKKKNSGVENYQRCLFILKHLGGGCYTLSVPMLRVRASAERYHIYPFIPQFYSYSLYEQTYHSFGINISTSVSHLCSPLFIGIHLFIHSLSHLASEGLTWRSLRPSKEKVKRTYKSCKAATHSAQGPQL